MENLHSVWSGLSIFAESERQVYDYHVNGLKLMLMHPSDLFKNHRNIVPNKWILMLVYGEANNCCTKQKEKNGNVTWGEKKKKNGWYYSNTATVATDVALTPFRWCIVVVIGLNSITRTTSNFNNTYWRSGDVAKKKSPQIPKYVS